MNHAFSKIWILIILIIFIGGGLLAYQYLLVPKEEMETPGEGVVEEETANWKTYRNEEYGFEIKHPTDWYVYVYPQPYSPAWMKVVPKLFIDFQNTSEEKVTIPAGGDFYKIVVKVIRGPIDEWIDKAKSQGSIEEVTIGLERGYKGIFSGMGSVIVIPKNDIYIDVNQPLPIECWSLECKIFNQMLSTFRFLE